MLDEQQARGAPEASGSAFARRNQVCAQTFGRRALGSSGAGVQPSGPNALARVAKQKLRVFAGRRSVLASSASPATRVVARGAAFGAEPD